MKPLISISNTFSKTGFKVLNDELCHDFDLLNGFDDKTVQALIIRSKDYIDSEFLSSYKNLEIIVSATSGFDHMAYKDSNISMCYSPKANTQSATEISVFHILNFLKNGKSILNPKSWREPEMISEELSLKSIGIIGLGRIGTKVVNILKAFGCKNIYGYDPYVSDGVFAALGVKNTPFNEVLNNADILSLHCPLTLKTKEIINRESLKLMKKNTLLVNCARGQLINTGDLLNSLNNNEIQGACLDVFDIEPVSESSKLRNHPLINWSPHIGAFTKQAQIKSALEAAQQIKSWFKGDRDMLHSLPPKVAWAKDL